MLPHCLGTLIQTKVDCVEDSKLYLTEANNDFNQVLPKVTSMTLRDLSGIKEEKIDLF